MYRTITRCRACRSGNLISVFDLGVQPLANDFILPGGESQGHAPLKVMFCKECTMSQLSVVVDPKIIYTNYPYVTSRSQTMQDHFHLLWTAINNECNPLRVIEIGSNDGLFLEYCRLNGADSVIGIDPAENLRPAPDSGIKSVCGLFNSDTAQQAAGLAESPNVVVARHVFAHIDNWEGFMCHLDLMCSRDTLVVIEVPYVGDLLAGAEFDTIYHEHLSYVSIKSVEYLLRETPFHLHKIIRFSVHGGAIVMMLRRNDSNFPVDASVEHFTSREVVSETLWTRFWKEADTNICAVHEFVHRKVGRERATVCGFGASAKSTVWINACHFERSEIDFICDCTPSKQGRLSPGNNIPILPEADLMNKLPDYAILFAWNFKAEILKNHQSYLDHGGHFIIPGRTIEIV